MIQVAENGLHRSEPGPGAIPISPAGEDARALGDARLLTGHSPAPFAPFAVRRAIGGAQDFEQLREVADGLGAAVVSLHDSRVPPAKASEIISTLGDSFTRRSIELSISELGPPPCPLSWIALGSHGRREPVPG